MESVKKYLQHFDNISYDTKIENEQTICNWEKYE